MMTSPDTTKRSATIQSVSIAARFLDILAKADGPLVLGEIARRAQTGSSTAHRYMQSLVREGLAAQDDVTGYYDLGPAALSIGVRAIRRIDAVEVAARAMKALLPALEPGATFASAVPETHPCRVIVEQALALRTSRGPVIADLPAAVGEARSQQQLMAHQVERERHHAG